MVATRYMGDGAHPNGLWLMAPAFRGGSFGFAPPKRAAVAGGKRGSSFMTFQSILFKRPEDAIKSESLAPAFFADLNLDQIIAAVTRGREEYNLKPFFYTALSDVAAVEYRHDVFRDLENRVLLEYVETFSEHMRTMRANLALADRLYYAYQKKRWFLAAVEAYCEAVSGLANHLTRVDLKSSGFLGLRDYVAEYAGSPEFTQLLADTTRLAADLSAVTYCLNIKGNSIKIRKYELENDYSAVIEETFARFQQGTVKDYRVKYSFGPEMNHVEAGVLELVAKLYPEEFSRLDEYCSTYSNFLAEKLKAFDREIKFYVAYLEYINRIKRAGLSFCYPRVSDDCKEVHSYAGFDLALAAKLVNEDSTVVWNDFHLNGPERILVVSGPNQGGKTTFARAFGQLHFLAATGCPVPGREARLLLFDRMFTHFEKEEDIQNLRGKLQDDLLRIYHILNQATARSIIIMNEIFTSTTLQDAVFLGRKVLGRISALDCLAVFVTFIDELAASGAQTVSMVSTVRPENPALRTYKVVRRPAGGLSYALSIAEKYRLTYDWLKERIRS